MRFELDSGQVMRFRWAKIAVGTPLFNKKRNRDDMPDEERNWMTIETRDGEVFAFRKADATLVVPAAQLQTELSL